MKREPYAQVVFNQVIREIYTGNLRVGERLPPAQRMCQEFAVGANTISSGVKKLAEAGFVSTTRGRAPIVISDCGSREEALRQFCGCAQGIREGYDLLCVVLPYMAGQSAQAFCQEDVSELRGLAELLQRDGGRDGQTFQYGKRLFMKKLIGKASNKKAIYLCRNLAAMAILPRLPFDLQQAADVFLRPGRVKFVRRVSSFPDLIAGGEFEKLKREVSCLCANLRGDILSAISYIQRETHFLPAPQTERPVYLDAATEIASRIIDGLFLGALQKGEYLPSVKEISRFFKVATAEVRKANQLLCDLGLARTINGRGTYITLFENPKETDPVWGARMRARLSDCMETMDFIVGVSWDLAAGALRKNYSAGLLLEKLGAPRSIAALVLWRWIMQTADCGRMCRLNPLLNQDLSAMFYLRRFVPDWGGRLEAIRARCLAAAESLRNKAEREFCERTQKAMEEQYALMEGAYRRFLSEEG